jgi:hypothetical protein
MGLAIGRPPYYINLRSGLFTISVVCPRCTDGSLARAALGQLPVAARQVQ